MMLDENLCYYVECPWCKRNNEVTIKEYSNCTSEERPMGPSNLYEIDENYICDNCNKKMNIKGIVSEYPMGSIEYTNLSVRKVQPNNADYGLSLQYKICNAYALKINEWAQKQFDDAYNDEYKENIEEIIPEIFNKLGDKPVRLLTYSQEFTKGSATTSPHNFLLKNNKTLSIRTTKTSDKVAPRTVGQAGFPILNEFFSEIYGEEIKNQEDIRKMIYNHIHEVLPIFIDHLFQSDYTVIINKMDKNTIQVIKSDEVGNYQFTRDEFSFTKHLEDWKESITLKYHGISIAEIQTHEHRSFKFRFIISKIPEWFEEVKITNETLGMSAEAAICDYFGLEKPESFARRVSKNIESALFPVVEDAFKILPPAIKHSGSTSGERGGQSKCSYDFVLKDDLTLSLKTNKGKMVCPPEVGQPGAETCLLYFKNYFDKDLEKVTGDIFKKMVYGNIEKIMPIYVSHLFDSDWLLWIYETKNGYEFREISNKQIDEFEWKREKFSFTKQTIEEWNESNTVKYDGLSIGEFQVHKNRNCFKFRFNLANLLKLMKI